MFTNYINRDASVLTGKKRLKTIWEIDNFPLVIGCTDQPSDKDIVASLSFGICQDTGIIQIQKVLPLEVVYSQYHSEALGEIWDRHHSEFSGFISKYSPKVVFEIGGSDGRLAKGYMKNNSVKKWVIIDPNPAVESSGKIHVIPEAFGGDFKTKEIFDTVVHSHTLEHMYQPREFMESIQNILKIGDMHIFSFPNLYQYLKNRQSNTLNFEHTILLSEYFVEQLLKMYGFEILEKRYFEQHSIFYSTKKVSDKKIEYAGENRYEEYYKEFKNYALYFENEIDRLNKKIGDFDGEVYIFGAHVFSQFLLALGLSKVRVSGILDNSKIKEGKRLYGTDLIVSNPSIIRSRKAAVVVKVGAYQEEVLEQLKKINPQVLIWE